MDQSMTGADFNFVMASAQGAESHFRLKSEKEWESQIENLGELSEEFFSLDLSALEKSISCIPLYKQIGLDREEFDKDMLERLEKKAEDARGGSLIKSAVVEEEVSQKIMDILNVGKLEKPKELSSTEIKQSIEPVLESHAKEESNVDVTTVKSDVPVKDDAPVKEVKPVVEKVEEAPLGQRKNRRQRSANTKKTSESKPDISNIEDKDLKFMESLDEKVEKPTEAIESKPSTVVPVNIVKEDTKNLEDWLDDFLDD